jgi:adenosylhomocysteinase
MKDGAILANSGHFNVEIDIPALAKMAKTKREARPYVDEYTLPERTPRFTCWAKGG